jgi:hypothetical protein
VDLMDKRIDSTDLGPMPDLDDLEERTYRTTQEDGLIDLLAGLGLLGFGLGVLFSIPMLTILAPALLATMWKPLKDRMATRHIGYVRFSEPRRRKERRGLWTMQWALVGAFLGGLVLWLVMERGGPALRDSAGSLGLAPFALMVALMLGVAGIAFRISAFYWYAALAALAAALVPFGIPGEHGLTVVAGVITLAGLAKLIRFMRRYPPRPAEASS